MKIKIKNNLFSTFLTLFCLFQLNGIAIANEGAMTEAENLYLSGLENYKNKKYAEAIKQLESAVALEPEISKYHHILAVSYGREAENASWFKAMDYAKRTLTHLKKSDELDPNNLKILDDLMNFYHEAPGFLGGDTKKGNEIEALIKKLSQETQENDKI
jgi:tetratricopeptide (TPR) repeat protein